MKAEHIWLVPEAANDNAAALFDAEATLALAMIGGVMYRMQWAP